MKQLFLSLILMLTVGFLAAQTTPEQHASKGNTNEGIGTLMPAFEFFDMSNKPIGPASLPFSTPVIFFYFDPDCDHCQQIATWLNEQAAQFKGITLVMVSWAEVEAIKAFPGKYLPDYPGSLFVTKDSKYSIDKWFGYSETPSIYVYNRHWKRTASFKDEVRPEILVKFAKQD